MKKHSPDYRRIIHAALRKGNAAYPLYEHNVSVNVLDVLTGEDITGLTTNESSRRDKIEGFRTASTYLADIGYDVFPFEGCITELVQGGQGLMGRADSIITNYDDVVKYPWEALPDRYFERFTPSFEALAEAMPSGMKAIGGVGNGVFETIQDFVPMTDLAFLEMDDPDAFSLLWDKIGDSMTAIWERFMKNYADLFAVCRFGDDLGFKTSLLMKPSTVEEHIIPQYKKVVELVHSFSKPFLLHSCGSIFQVMDSIIETTRIDAKHSNEDAIAPFSTWVEKYGDRIGLFGGIDMNILCTEDEQGIKLYVKEVIDSLKHLEKKPAGFSNSASSPSDSSYSSSNSAGSAGNARLTDGIALGSGNQIAEYVPPEHFTAMVEAIREFG